MLMIKTNLIFNKIEKSWLHLPAKRYILHAATQMPHVRGKKNEKNCCKCAKVSCFNGGRRQWPLPLLPALATALAVWLFLLELRFLGGAAALVTIKFAASWISVVAPGHNILIVVCIVVVVVAHALGCGWQRAALNSEGQHFHNRNAS